MNTEPVQPKSPALSQSQHVEDFTNALEALENLERTLEILIAGEFVTDEKVNQAFSLVTK